jgi:DNA repair exonuclease SbcCD ATPase subunit
MIIKSIRLQNTFSHKDTTVELDKLGLCLVNGSNGAGKSSIIKGLLFGFFCIGTDDVVNKKKGKDACVTITGKYGKDRFIVQRYRKHSEHKNNLYLYINDKVVAAATTTDMQTKLEKYLGLDYKAFTTIASFSSDMMMFAAATDADRKAIFERILQDVQAYADYLSATKDEIALISTDLEEQKYRVEVDEHELEVVKKVLHTEEERSLMLEQRRQEEMEELTTELDEYNTKQVALAKLLGRRVRYNNAAVRLEVWLDKHNEVHSEIMETERELHALDVKESELMDDSCPTCSRSITKALREKEIKKIDKERIKILAEQKTLQDKAEVRSKVTDSLNRLYDNISALNYKMVRYEDLADKIAKVETKIDKVQSRMDNAANGTELWIKKVKKLSKSLATRQRKIKQYEEELAYLEEIATAFSKQGIPNTIIARALDMLEQCVNGYLDILTSGALSIELTGMTKTKKGLVRNKIGINVVSDSGVTNFDSYSGGERQRLNIALLLALRDVAEGNKGIKLNCLFLDEILDLSLDEEGIEDVLILLHHKKSAVDSIFVITPKKQLLHNTGVNFDTVINVQKTAGYSTIDVKEVL